MQTFVPNSASRYFDVFAYLDALRCRKNLIESLQLYQNLSGFAILSASKKKEILGLDFTHNINHPANKMWENSINAFSGYIIGNWQYLVQNNLLGTSTDTHRNILNALSKGKLVETEQKPPWWGDKKVHDSHAKALRWKGEWNTKVYLTSFLLNIPKNIAAKMMQTYVDIDCQKFVSLFQNTDTTAKQVRKVADICEFYREVFPEYSPELNYFWPKG